MASIFQEMRDFKYAAREEEKRRQAMYPDDDRPKAGTTTAGRNRSADALYSQRAVAQELSTDPTLQAERARAEQEISQVDPAAYRQMAAAQAAQDQSNQAALAEQARLAAAGRAQQQRYIDAIGAAPSAVDLETRIGRAALARAIASQVGSAPGGYSPAAARAALLARGQGEASLGASAALAKAQEQRAAAAQQLEGATAMRAGDVAAGTLSQAGMEALRRGLAQQATLTGAADTTSGVLQQLADQRDAMLRQELLGYYGGTATPETGPGAGEQLGALLGGLAGIVGPIAVASDERVKRGVAEDDRDVEGLLDALTPYRYRYRDPELSGARPGEQHGVMAQDLEQSRIGRGMVHRGEDGVRRVDYSPATLGPVVMSSLANLNRRLRAQEMRNGSQASSRARG